MVHSVKIPEEWVKYLQNLVHNTLSVRLVSCMPISHVVSYTVTFVGLNFRGKSSMRISLNNFRGSTAGMRTIPYNIYISIRV